MIAYIKDDVLNDNKSFIQAVCIKYDGKYEPIEFLPLSSYNQSVNEPKPTVSKMESVDNYLCKWQKLKEFISNRSACAGYVVQVRLIWDILDKMQELEAEDE